jgi:hypothetical protein
MMLGEDSRETNIDYI